jgi:hypothetical protein
VTWFSTAHSSSPAVFTSVPDVLGPLEQLSSWIGMQVFWNVMLHWASRMVLTYPPSGTSSSDHELWPFKLPAISCPKTVSHPRTLPATLLCEPQISLIMDVWSNIFVTSRSTPCHPSPITTTGHYKLVSRTRCPISLPQHIILSHKLQAPDWLLCQLSPTTPTTYLLIYSMEQSPSWEANQWLCS